MRELRKLSGLDLEQVIKLYTAVRRFHEAFAGEKCICKANDEKHMAVRATNQDGRTVFVHASILPGVLEVSVDASKIFAEGYQASIKVEDPSAFHTRMADGEIHEGALRVIEIANAFIDQALGHRPDAGTATPRIRAVTWAKKE